MKEDDSQPPMRSFVPMTPASAARASRRGADTSARATRGCPSTRSRNSGGDSIEKSATKSRSEVQEPRKLVLSPEQKENCEETSTENNEPNNPHQYLFNLPPSLLPYWCTLMICSALCLAAVASGTPLTTSSSSATAHDGSKVGPYENLQMIMAISTLSLMLTFLASACYIWIPASFVGTLYEVTVIGLNLILWCGALPIIMNPENDLAVQGTSIVNGNLFGLSWIAFFLSWVVLKLVIEQLWVMEQARGGNLAYMTPSGKSGYKPLIPITPYRLANALMILSSLVVLVSSARAYKQQLCSDWNRQLCKRTLFCTSVSIMSLAGLLIAWAVYLWRVNSVPSETSRNTLMPSAKNRLLLTGLLAFGWLLATGLGTFGQHAPGHAVGNFHIALWSSFGISLYLFKKTMLEYFTTQHQGLNASVTRRREEKPKSRRKMFIPGLIRDNDEEADEVEPPISTKATDDMSETIPSVTRSPGSNNSHRSSSGKKDSISIAMSLEEPFSTAELNTKSTGRKSENVERATKAVLQKTPTGTDETEEASFDEEVDLSVATPRRGSVTRSSGEKEHRSAAGSSSPGEDSDFYRVKPMTIPFGTDDENLAEESLYEEGESTFDHHHALSCSAITTAVDNTTRAEVNLNEDVTRDVLIDPDDF